MLRFFNRRNSLIIFNSLFIFFIYRNFFIQSQNVFELTTEHSKSKSILNDNLSFKNISIVYYTPLYGKRVDSHGNIFNNNLNQICHLIDPEDYSLADNVIVNLIDLVSSPTVSYRKENPSQLWIFYSEESPRNSYRTVQINHLKDLDDWFNLTATLKPESDFHIQYRGYRIKPKIGELIQNKFNINLQQSNNLSSDNIQNHSSSIYLNTLSSILKTEFINRKTLLNNLCPYTCNKPISNNLIESLQPYLKPPEKKIFDKNIVYIAWFVSNCNTHSRREDYVNKLRSQKGIHVDIFGKCKSIYHSPIIPIHCQKGTPKCMENILKNYQFYLSFENSKCDTYITEKYWIQGLNGHAIPIVLGAKKQEYERIAVPNSFIHVDDFQSVEELAKELHRLNNNHSEYERYLQWTQLYDIADEYRPLSLMDMHSALCLIGHYRYLYSMKDDNQIVDSLMNTIKNLFQIANINLKNFNWAHANTDLIRISDFYNPDVNCWDDKYPSLFKQVYNYLFTWWKLF